MGKYLKMAGVFDFPVKPRHVHDENGYGFKLMLFHSVEAECAAHAINSHDEIVEDMQHYKQEAEQWEVRATKEASRVQDMEAEVDRLRRQLHFCEASRGQLIDQVNKMKRDVFEGKHQQKPYL